MAVRYRSVRTGKIVSRDGLDDRLEKSRVWQRVEETNLEAAEADPAEPFDPGVFSVREVNAYLEDADLSERERVLQVESGGKGRTRILTGPYSDLSELES